jgi:NAD(P)-dependent dehydrogenase (short-subunit alcohol dehydrogenase family)
VLYVNAGRGEFGKLGEITEQHFDDIINFNVRGTLFTVQKALPLLVAGGSIIMTGRWKHKGISELWRIQCQQGGDPLVRAHLGYGPQGAEHSSQRFEPRHDRHAATRPAGRARKELFKSLIPRGILGRPEEIATAALFLASSDSSFVNGVELFVDGGTAQI